MTGKCDPTTELIAYLEMRLAADGLDYREAVMIEDLVASLSQVRDSGAKNPVRLSHSRPPAKPEPERD